MDKYFFISENQPIGPIEFEELVDKIGSKEILSSTKVWKDGLPDWVDAGELEEFKGFFQVVPPPIPQLMPPPVPFGKTNLAQQTQLEIKNSISPKDNFLVILLSRNWKGLLGLIIGITLLLINCDSSETRTVEITDEARKREIINQFVTIKYIYGDRLGAGLVGDGTIDVRFTNSSNEYTFDIKRTTLYRMIGGNRVSIPSPYTFRVILGPDTSINKDEVRVPLGDYRMDKAGYPQLAYTTVTTTETIETKTPSWFKVIGWIVIIISLLYLWYKNK